jgi:hypothetical protein
MTAVFPVPDIPVINTRFMHFLILRRGASKLQTETPTPYRLSRSRYCLRNLATLGAITIWQ